MLNFNLSKKGNVKYHSLMRVTVALLLLFIFQYTAYAINWVLYCAWRRGFLPATWEIVATGLLRNFAVLFAILIVLKFFEKKPLNRNTVFLLGLTGKKRRGNFSLGLGFGARLVVANIIIGGGAGPLGVACSSVAG